MKITVTVTANIPDSVVKFIGYDNIAGVLAEHVSSAMVAVQDESPEMIEDFEVETGRGTVTGTRSAGTDYPFPNRRTDRGSESDSPARSERPATRAAQTVRKPAQQPATAADGGMAPKRPGRPTRREDYIASDDAPVMSHGPRSVENLIQNGFNGERVRVYDISSGKRRRVVLNEDGEAVLQQPKTLSEDVPGVPDAQRVSAPRPERQQPAQPAEQPSRAVNSFAPRKRGK